MKKKGKKGAGKQAKDMKPARVATPVREISVQTEESSPQLLYIASRLTSEDIALYKSTLSKDPKVPDVLLEGDDDKRVAEPNLTASSSGIEASTSSSCNSDRCHAIDTSRKVFSHIPLRKTAPRGRAHVIHRSRNVFDYKQSHSQQDEDKAISGQSGIQALMTPELSQGKESEVTDINKRISEIYVNNACLLRRAENSKAKRNCDESSCDKLKDNAVLAAYKKIITGRKSPTDAITPYNDKECEGHLAKVEKSRGEEKEERSEQGLSAPHDIDEPQRKPLLVASGIDEQQGQPLLVSGDIDEQQGQPILVSGDIDEHLRQQHSASVNNELSNVDMEMKSFKADSDKLASVLPGNKLQVISDIDSTKIDQVSNCHDGVVSTDVTSDKSSNKTLAKKYVDQTVVENIEDAMLNQINKKEKVISDNKEKGQQSCLENSALIMCLQDGVASYKIWQQENLHRSKTFQHSIDGEIVKEKNRHGEDDQSKKRTSSELNERISNELELQEPMLSSEINFNQSTKTFLPPLLRTKLMIEADVHVPLEELKLNVKAEKNRRRNIDFNSQNMVCFSESGREKKEAERHMMKNSSDLIGDLVGCSDNGEITNIESNGMNTKRQRKLHKQKNRQRKSSKLLRKRPTRKCAPTVFYEKDKKKQDKPKIEKKLHNDHQYSKVSKAKFTSLKKMSSKDSLNGSKEISSKPKSSSMKEEKSQKITMIANPPAAGRVIGDRKRKRSNGEGLVRFEPYPKRKKMSLSQNDSVEHLDSSSNKSEDLNTYFASSSSKHGVALQSVQNNGELANWANEEQSKENDSENNKACSFSRDMTDLPSDHDCDGVSESESESFANSLVDATKEDMSAYTNGNAAIEEESSKIDVNTEDESFTKNKDDEMNKMNVLIEGNLKALQEQHHDADGNIQVPKTSNIGNCETSSPMESNVATLIRDRSDSVTDFIAGRIKEKASKKYIITGKDKRGSAGWEESLRQKPRKTELFQVNLAPQKAKVKDSDKSNCNNEVANNERNIGQGRGRPRNLREEKDKMVIDPTLEINIDHRSCNDPNLGEVVWGKLGRQRWWPAIVVEGYMVLKKQADPGKSWLLWFGDHKISELSREKTVPFVSNYSRLYGCRNIGVLFQQALREAVQVCAERCCFKCDSSQLDMWAKNGFVDENSCLIDKSTFSPSKDKPLPDLVLEFISQLRYDVRKNMDSDNNEEDENQLKKSDHGDALDKVKEREKELEDICISCNDSEQEVVFQHPLVHGGLCKECKQELTESFFAVGEDGTGMFCVICSNGGKMFVCENSNCNSVFCYECVKLFLDEERLEKIKEADPWICFLCCPYSEETHGHIIPKTEWKHNILKLYDSGYRVEDQNFDYLLKQDKKKIRVLSLFDGIGTGKVVLDLLGLDIDAYYTSEIDAESLLVTSFHYGEMITPLGDVTKITSEKLKEISPIDLLIGGSPCNDLSIANPVRKGFNDFSSTAMLFFDFVRVLKCLQNFSDGHHVFWLYENVASMKKECQDIISRFLECEPALWDAKYFSAQARPRYFWGNIPGMYSTPDLTDIKSTTDLDDVLSQNCNRKATVKVLRTVTTRQNSLKQGKNDAIFPVTMNGQDDMIWVSELERVFGFPDHYTDVGNIPVTKRRQMIGKAWSVPVVKNILHILTDFFAAKEREEANN